MLLQLLKKKLSGSCHIRIFTLSKVLTLMEVILAILVAVFMMGAEINGTDLFGCPVGTWYEWLIDIIIIVCLGLEYLGLQKKIFGIIVFSCVFRCIILLCSFGGVILVCVYIYFMDIMKQWMESGLLNESDPELSESLKCIESPFWYVAFKNFLYQMQKNTSFSKLFSVLTTN